jgi:hypothetical protein
VQCPGAETIGVVAPTIIRRPLQHAVRTDELHVWRGIIEGRWPVVLGAARSRPSRQTADHPIPGDGASSAARHTDCSVNHRLRGVIPVQSRTYEIIFSGQAGRTLRAQFDDCEVTTNPETTTLRAELPDPAAFSGLVERIVGLGLEIIDVHLLTQPSLP